MIHMEWKDPLPLSDIFSILLWIYNIFFFRISSSGTTEGRQKFVPFTRHSAQTTLQIFTLAAAYRSRCVYLSIISPWVVPFSSLFFCVPLCDFFFCVYPLVPVCMFISKHLLKYSSLSFDCLQDLSNKARWKDSWIHIQQQQVQNKRRINSRNRHNTLLC